MNPESLTHIERLNYVLGSIMVGIAFFFVDFELTKGILVGVALTCINFTLIRKMVNKLLKMPPSNRGGTALLFVPKMTGLLVAASLCMFFLKISPIGVGIGFSVFLISITIVSLQFMSNQDKTS